MGQTLDEINKKYFITCTERLIPRENLQRGLVNFFSFNVSMLHSVHAPSTQFLTRNNYSFTRKTNCSRSFRTIESHQLKYIELKMPIVIVNCQARSFYIFFKA